MILIDNKIQVAKIRMAYIVTLSIGLILLVLPPLIDFTKFESLMSQITGALLLMIFIYLLLIKPEYLYFSVENNTKLTIRYYQAFPAFRKYKAFEIKIASIQDFEVKNSLFNRVKMIRFLVSTKNKVGKYPWLSLSAVPKKDIDSLMNFLNKILPPDKRKKL